MWFFLMTSSNTLLIKWLKTYKCLQLMLKDILNFYEEICLLCIKYHVLMYTEYKSFNISHDQYFT